MKGTKLIKNRWVVVCRQNVLRHNKKKLWLVIISLHNHVASANQTAEPIYSVCATWHAGHVKNKKQMLPWQLEANCKCYFWRLKNESYSFIQTKIVLPGTEVTQLWKKKKERNHSCIKALFKSYNYHYGYDWQTTLMTQIGKWKKKVANKKRRGNMKRKLFITERADHPSTSGCCKTPSPHRAGLTLRWRLVRLFWTLLMAS